MAQVEDHEVGQHDGRALHKHLLVHGFLGIEELPESLDVDLVLTVEPLEVLSRLHGVKPDEGAILLEAGCNPQREVVHVDERSWLHVTLDVDLALEGMEHALPGLVGDEESLASNLGYPLDAGHCDNCAGAVRLSRLHRFLIELLIGLKHGQRVVGRVLEHHDTPPVYLLGLD